MGGINLKPPQRNISFILILNILILFPISNVQSCRECSLLGYIFALSWLFQQITIQIQGCSTYSLMCSFLFLLSSILSVRHVPTKKRQSLVPKQWLALWSSLCWSLNHASELWIRAIWNWIRVWQCLNTFS